MICITYLPSSTFVTVPFGQKINQCLKSCDFPYFFKFWPKFNKTGFQYSKSIPKIDIYVQNAFLLQPI